MWRGLIRNRRFGGTCRLHLQGKINNASDEKVSGLLVRYMLVASNLFLPRIISSALNMEATRSSETSVYNKFTQRHIPENRILQSPP
jgi:hypothetical protein